MTTHRFPIGTRYTTRHGTGRKSFTREHTIVDQLTTRNAAGDVVSIRYVCAHEFFGQTITESDVCDTTIARAIFAENGSLPA